MNSSLRLQQVCLFYLDGRQVAMQILFRGGVDFMLVAFLCGFHQAFSLWFLFVVRPYSSIDTAIAWKITLKLR